MKGNRSFNDFIQLKKRVLTITDELYELVTRINAQDNDQQFSSYCSKLQELRKKSETETFKVLVVGEFSTGKSSFINALLNSNLLPTDDNETTATINIIKYGVKPEIEIIYWGERDNEGKEIRAGKREIISIDELVNYTTSLNSSSHKIAEQIRCAVINYPTDLCKNDVEIIDTPGLNSTIGYHEETTLNYLANGHCAIMLLKATQLFTKTEIDYLKKFKRYLNKIFFVVNKVDLLKSDFYSEDAILSRRRKLTVLEQAEDFRYYLTSSKKAINGEREKSGMDEFQNGFMTFLASSEKAKEMVNPIVIQDLRIISSISSALVTIKNGLSFSPKEYDDKIKALAPDLEKIKEKIISINSIIERKSQNILLKYEIFIRDESIKVSQDIKWTIKGYEGDLDELEAYLKEYISEELTLMYQRVMDFATEQLNDLNEEIVERFNDYLSSFNDYQMGISSSVGETGLQVYKPGETNFHKDEFKLLAKQFGSGVGLSFVVGSLLTGPIGVFVSILGTFMFAGYLEERHKKKKLEEIAQKISVEINHAMQKGSEEKKIELKNKLALLSKEMNKEMNQSLATVQASIEKIRKKRTEEAEKLEKYKEQITRHLNSLLKIESELKDINNTI